MKIGNIQEFKEAQLGKVERRKQEEKQIKKGIYQMQMLIDCQSTEIFDKESERSKERTEASQAENKETGTQKQEHKKTDIHTEMKKMMSVTKQQI